MRLIEEEELIVHLKIVLLSMSMFLVLLPQTLYSQSTQLPLLRTEIDGKEILLISEEGAVNMANWYRYYEWMQAEYETLATDFLLEQERSEAYKTLSVRLEDKTELCEQQLELTKGSFIFAQQKVSSLEATVKDMDKDLIIAKDNTRKWKKKAKRRNMFNILSVTLVAALGTKAVGLW